MYVTCLSVASALILFATSWPTPVKYSLVALGCAIAMFLWFFLAQRRKNISRDAVDIEKQLTAKAKRK